MNQEDKIKDAERNGFYRGFKYGGIVILILCFILTSVSAATTIPRIEPYVNDFAGLLSPQEELSLNQLADGIENRTTFEIAIVTIAGTGGQERLEFAGKIGDQNGVGKKDSDNGIVVLWSTADDAGGAIATGRGSESFITDATTGTIGRAARPYFDKGEYYKGLNYIVVELDKVIIAHQTQNNTVGVNIGGDYPPLPSWVWFAMVFGLIFIISKVFFGRSDSDSSDEDDKGYWRRQVYKRNGKWYNSEADRSYSTAAAAAVALSILSNSDDDSDSDSDSDDSSSSSGSSGGFGSFGGGSFGGGGGKF